MDSVTDLHARLDAAASTGDGAAVKTMAMYTWVWAGAVVAFSDGTLYCNYMRRMHAPVARRVDAIMDAIRQVLVE